MHFRLRIQTGRKIRSGPLTFWITALWTALKHTKVGGYMILFSVLIALSENLASCFPAVQILLPVLEITNGIQLIGMSAVSFPVKYILALSLTAFGGICAAAQTQCMIQKAGFSIFPYITQKLATALVTSLLGILYLLCFA